MMAEESSVLLESGAVHARASAASRRQIWVPTYEHRLFLVVCSELQEEGSYGPRQPSRGVGAGLREGIAHRFL
jgi:hypothetical protein